MPGFIDMRRFLTLLMQQIPGLSAEIAELAEAWCESETAREAGVVGAQVQIQGYPAQCKMARIVLSNAPQDREFIFPSRDFAAYIVTRSHQSELMKRRLLFSLAESWRRYPELFHRYRVAFAS